MVKQTNSPNSKYYVWRPQPIIAVKVIGVAMYRGRLLAAEIYNDAGKLKGVRPLGGHIEFGETREAALRREFREELDTEIEITGSWRMFENLYEHEQHVGHEYILSVGVGFANRTLYKEDTVAFSEDSGQEVRARWVPVSDLKQGVVALFPPKLIDYL